MEDARPVDPKLDVRAAYATLREYVCNSRVFTPWHDGRQTGAGGIDTGGGGLGGRLVQQR